MHSADAQKMPWDSARFPWNDWDHRLDPQAFSGVLETTCTLNWSHGGMTYSY